MVLKPRASRAKMLVIQHFSLQMTSYLPEFYIQLLANFDETNYIKEDYGKDTTALLNWAEEKWL
ncbi:uncharacterized protein BJX67DRAFT_348650 [Aspergillus lucknowensis]|uniref:Uncharacterized protein n=1 Tax=Aspergillus lucknowensis TaxID=176173 RepID=A0ABR4LX37_9EURO